MAKREFLQLAHDFDSKKDYIGGYFMSEKLDGMRCFWDGGITTGMPKDKVPWANLAKDERYKETQIATGLWSRYGNVIHASTEFIKALPNCPLDGELYSREYSRQQLMEILKKIEPNPFDWEYVTYFCFDRPAYETIFADGLINTTHYTKKFYQILPWIKNLDINIVRPLPRQMFDQAYKMLRYTLNNNPVAIALLQFELPYNEAMARITINAYMEQIIKKGGEGIMLRHPSYPYVCERTRNLLKVKMQQDAEATVIGYTTGRETDLGSKLLGKMGALLVQFEQVKFELSGFTDEERTFKTEAMTQWATQNPDRECPDWIVNEHFPIGALVTFKYRGLTDKGVPQEARYLRKKENE